MNRRDSVIALLALGAVPRTSFGQQPSARVARVGFLGSARSAASAWRMDALRAGLREFGYVEGKNIVIEFRWAENKHERLPELAAELVRLEVDVIVTHNTPTSLAARQATTTIPIVIVSAIDPVASGLVASLARPGGNITGQTFFVAEHNMKRLELLKDLLPRIRRVGILFNSNNSSQPVREMEGAARSLNMEVQQFGVQNPSDFESAFVAMSKNRVEAIALLDDSMLTDNTAAVVGLAAKHRIPSIGPIDYAERGGLMAYGADLPAMYRRAAYFMDKILKGASPGDLPVERATKFDMVINLKTAKALGIKIPQPVLLRADRVIE